MVRFNATSRNVQPVEFDTFVSAFGHLIGPHAHPSLAVVGQSGATLVAGRFAVPAVPEHVALLLVREDAVQADAVRRADGRLQLRSFAAVHVVQIVAVLSEELVIGGVKRQTVTACL